MATVKTERVLVVPTELVHEIGHFQGFCAEVDRYLERLLDARVTSYRPRSEMEEDPSFKQLIPYCIFRCGNQVFQYTRGRSQGESRLHQLRSIGVGGHISTDDRNLFGTSYEEALHRELAEEVYIESAYRERCIGLINDDETPVGRVHLGIVHVFDLDEPNVRPRERSLTRAGFEPTGALLEHLDEFETWSQICLRQLEAQAAD
jgi:predicted NUDIX family phosphoesterase